MYQYLLILFFIFSKKMPQRNKPVCPRALEEAALALRPEWTCPCAESGPTSPVRKQLRKELNSREIESIGEKETLII